jgi:uncharacterized membrane protein
MENGMDRAGNSSPATPQHPELALRRGHVPAFWRAEVVISYALRGGVMLSAATIAAGVVAFFGRYGNASARSIADQTFPHTFAAVVRGVAHGDPLALIALGLLILLATPMMRVLIAIAAFGLERDWRYVAITAVVLAILLVSLLLGKGSG